MIMESVLSGECWLSLKMRKAADCPGGLRLLSQNEKTTSNLLESLPVVCPVTINRRWSTNLALGRPPKKAAKPEGKVVEHPEVNRHCRRSCGNFELDT